MKSVLFKSIPHHWHCRSSWPVLQDGIHHTTFTSMVCRRCLAWFVDTIHWPAPPPKGTMRFCSYIGLYSSVVTMPVIYTGVQDQVNSSINILVLKPSVQLSRYSNDWNLQHAASLSIFLLADLTVNAKRPWRSTWPVASGSAPPPRRTFFYLQKSV